MKKEIEIIWKGNLPLTALTWEFDTKAAVTFSREFEEKIENFWEKAIKKNPNMYDGTLLCVHKINCQKEKINLVIGYIPFSVVYYHYHNKKPLMVSYGSLGFQAKIYNPERTHVLIGKRAATQYKLGYYAFPGGILEKKDLQGTITEACLREIKEETLLEINAETFKLLTVYREDSKISTGILIEVETREEIAANEKESIKTPGNEEWEKQELTWYPVTKVKELKNEQTLEGLTITINDL